MTVYIDNANRRFSPSYCSGRRPMIMCHMIADSEAELHHFAGVIGMKREWYQGDHYDVSKMRKVVALKTGAIEITTRQMVLIRRKLRGRRHYDPQRLINELEKIGAAAA